MDVNSAALCQIFDSIFSEYRLASFVRGAVKVFECHWNSYTDTKISIFLVDVPMSRVKFNVNTEYAYLQNFKVLQSMSSYLTVTRSKPIDRRGDFPDIII